MLSFILALLKIILVFFTSAIVLVKLYRCGVKPWMVQATLTLLTFLYIVIHPFEINDNFFNVFVIFAIASIFTTEKPVEKDETISEEPEEKVTDSTSGSFSSTPIWYAILKSITNNNDPDDYGDCDDYDD